MRRAPSHLQVAALMAAAAVGLHQARYAVGAGGVEGHLSPGHSYLSLLIPFVGALCTLALSLFVRRVALRSAPSRRISLAGATAHGNGGSGQMGQSGGDQHGQKTRAPLGTRVVIRVKKDRFNAGTC